MVIHFLSVCVLHCDDEERLCCRLDNSNTKGKELDQNRHRQWPDRQNIGMSGVSRMSIGLPYMAVAAIIVSINKENQKHIRADALVHIVT